MVPGAFCTTRTLVSVVTSIDFELKMADDIVFCIAGEGGTRSQNGSRHVEAAAT